MAKISAFNAFFDASGHPSDQPFVVVSGYVANVHQWQFFNRMWEEIHKRYEIGRRVRPRSCRITVRLLAPSTEATCCCVQPFARRSTRISWPKGIRSRSIGCGSGCAGGTYPVCQEQRAGGVMGSLIETGAPAVVRSFLSSRICQGRRGRGSGLLSELSAEALSDSARDRQLGSVQG